MTSQRFCLRWNNHQTNLLAVFDQLLHDETFIDVTLAVEGQHLKAHKMVLSACSPYFQQLFVSHPEKHPIVILRDVPFKDMKCLLDFMYRGEVSVDQDRLAAFLRVAESLRIKGLTEVNDDKPNAPAGAASTTTTSATASSASSAAQASSGTAATNTVSNVSAQKNSSGDSVTQVDEDDEDRCSPASNSIPVAASGQVQPGTGQVKQLPPLLSSTGIVTRSHSNSLLQQHHQPGNSAMLQTNPLLGTALSQQKRKRGRPRKLSGSDAGEGETDGNFIGGGAGEEYDSSSMDIMDVKIASSGASNSGDDDQQLRIVSSRTEDCETPMHEKSEQMDEYDDEEMDDDADELVEDDDLETGTGDEPGGTTPSLDESMEVTTDNANNATNNAHTNRSGRQHQRQGGGNSALAKPSRASKRTRTATTNLRNNENSNMSGMAFTPGPEELMIFPINLEKKNANRSYPLPVNASDEETESVLPMPVRLYESTSNRSLLRNPLPLLHELQRYGQLQELTIIEQRRSLPAHVVNGHEIGKNLKEVSRSSPSPPPCTEQKTDGVSNDQCSRAMISSDDVPKYDNITLTDVMESETDFHRKTPSNGRNDNPSPGAKGSKRRTRRTISPNDPAKALTEMSVRGLNLFRYATLNAGMYQCMECVKEGIEKTFKNKYSFQRHAFLYHEGKQRKVFPCSVCNKEFSRPDKMKNHLRMTHDSYEPKLEAPLTSNSNFLASQHCAGEVVQLQAHPSQPQHGHHQHQHLHQQAETTIPNQLHEEQRRRQQEQDVMKIRSVINAINLRELQQLQQHAQELRIRQSLEEQNLRKPIVARQMVEAPSVPAQLIPLNGIGSQ